MQPAEYSSIPRRALDVEDYIDILRRHKTWILAPAFGALVVAVVVAFLWPDTYVSTAVIRVVPSQVPENLVPTNVNSEISQHDFLTAETHPLVTTHLVARFSSPDRSRCSPDSPNRVPSRAAPRAGHRRSDVMRPGRAVRQPPPAATVGSAARPPARQVDRNGLIGLEVEHRQPDAVLVVQDEGLGQAGDLDHRSRVRHGSDLQDGGDEELGVGVLRVVQHLVGQAGLDDLAILHHNDAVR